MTNWSENPFLPIADVCLSFSFSYLTTSLMFITSALAIMFAVLMAPLSLGAATVVFKCANNGSITYQNTPCPSGVKRETPTVEKLNAERQKKLNQVGIQRPISPTSAPSGGLSSTTGGSSWSSLPSGKERPQVTAVPTPSSTDSFKCDGRIHCSQMTSCSEAKYFLSRCPGVKIDGDGDGIPCEDQLCRR